MAVVCGWVGEDILDTYTTERHPVPARLLQNTRAQIALMRPDPQTRALWEMFSDLMDLGDAHQYVADMLVGLDVRYDLGDDHRFVGTLRPDMKSTLERPDPDVVTAVTRSADLLREARGLLLDLVDRAEVRDAAAAWTGRVSTPSPPARTGWTSTPCRSGPTAVSPGPCPPGRTSTPPRWCVRWAPGSANPPERPH